MLVVMMIMIVLVVILMIVMTKMSKNIQLFWFSCKNVPISGTIPQKRPTNSGIGNPPLFPAIPKSKRSFSEEVFSYWGFSASSRLQVCLPTYNKWLLKIMPLLPKLYTARHSDLSFISKSMCCIIVATLPPPACRVQTNFTQTVWNTTNNKTQQTE